ncbi:DUF3592 domain-containing protein [Nonomuraea sp. NPDC050663]|uniref:DUF3592 domain-containing protein n=1 Tax=Nonomuraea sp. NPDC050663 TaxID=3364370 RepID=UPI0037A2A13E
MSLEFRAFLTALVALFFLGTTVYSVAEMRRSATILDGGIRTTASIATVEDRARGKDPISVFFKTETGETIFAALSDSTDAQGLRPGDTMEVIYDPRNPEHVIAARIADLTHHYVMIAFTALLALGAAWSGIRDWRNR